LRQVNQTEYLANIQHQLNQIYKESDDNYACVEIDNISFIKYMKEDGQVEYEVTTICVCVQHRLLRSAFKEFKEIVH
jgi:hypothetical protein